MYGFLKWQVWDNLNLEILVKSCINWNFKFTITLLQSIHSQCHWTIWSICFVIGEMKSRKIFPSLFTTDTIDMTICHALSTIVWSYTLYWILISFSISSFLDGIFPAIYGHRDILKFYIYDWEVSYLHYNHLQNGRMNQKRPFCRSCCKQSIRKRDLWEFLHLK